MKRKMLHAGKRSYVFLLLIAATALVLAFAKESEAKRRAPRPVAPIVIGGIEYRVPNTIESEGIVEAWSIKPQKLLWTRKMYLTLKVPFMETDVQLNFITNMCVGPGTNELTVINEKGRHYILNTTSRSVSWR